MYGTSFADTLSRTWERPLSFGEIMESSDASIRAMIVLRNVHREMLLFLQDNTSINVGEYGYDRPLVSGYDNN